MQSGQSRTAIQRNKLEIVKRIADSLKELIIKPTKKHAENRELILRVHMRVIKNGNPKFILFLLCKN